jgi:hypothetical protein
MHAVIYARFPTPRQGREQTIESQINALKNWANENGHKHFAREHLHRRFQHPSKRVISAKNLMCLTSWSTLKGLSHLLHRLKATCFR